MAPTGDCDWCIQALHSERMGANPAPRAIPFDAPRTGSVFGRALELLRRGHISSVASSLRLRLHSDLYADGVERDLSEPVGRIPVRMKFTVRPIEHQDHERLFGWDPAQKHEEAGIRAFVRGLAASRVGRGFVAVDEGHRPGFVQFVYRREDNEGLLRLFGGLMPQLADGEALLEGAFTHPDVRTKGLMPAAMAEICEMLANEGLKRAVSFVPKGNSGALRACRMVGFRPYCVRTAQWRFFHRTVRFDPKP
jgi:GNAT superfamily N-acetyltransferase